MLMCERPGVVFVPNAEERSSHLIALSIKARPTQMPCFRFGSVNVAGTKRCQNGRNQRARRGIDEEGLCQLTKQQEVGIAVTEP